MADFVKQFLLPSGLITWFILAGVGCLLQKKTRRFATRFLCTGGLLYLVFSSGPVSYFLIRWLENQSPAFSLDQHLTKFEDIVVLTGYARSNAHLPASSTVNASSAFRILEALRLHHLFPEARITISGYDDVPSVMKNLLLSLGVREELILLESESRNTYESALHLKDRMKNEAFLLVTSAGHMPRSLGVFLAQGMEPTPAPTDYMALVDHVDGFVLPDPNNLMRADLAVHEYLGLLWYRMNNRL